MTQSVKEGKRDAQKHVMKKRNKEFYNANVQSKMVHSLLVLEVDYKADDQPVYKNILVLPYVKGAQSIDQLTGTFFPSTVSCIRF